MITATTTVMNISTFETSTVVVKATNKEQALEKTKARTPSHFKLLDTTYSKESKQIQPKQFLSL